MTTSTQQYKQWKDMTVEEKLEDLKNHCNRLSGNVAKINDGLGESIITQEDEQKFYKKALETKGLNGIGSYQGCVHEFVYSHTESPGGESTTGPISYRVVICKKCGEIRKTL